MGRSELFHTGIYLAFPVIRSEIIICGRAVRRAVLGEPCVFSDPAVPDQKIRSKSVKS